MRQIKAKKYKLKETVPKKRTTMVTALAKTMAPLAFPIPRPSCAEANLKPEGKCAQFAPIAFPLM